ncbi:MAG: flagellar assembly protein FliW [Proteocatella sp.]
MEISTKYFNEVAISKDSILKFENGILGFEKFKDYVMINFELGSDDLMCLQSLDEKELAFVLVNPFNLKPDYSPSLTEEDVEELGISDSTEGVFCYAICTVKDNITENTVNLKSPIIVNPENMKAKQIVLENNEYAVRHQFKQFKNEGI